MPGPAKLKPENTCWVLVDHNALQGKLGESYSGRIRGVIDHHDEENTVPQATAPEPRIIEKCGSCTSLVTTYCKEAWRTTSVDPKETSIPGQGALENNQAELVAMAARYGAQVAQLGLASILVDTTNLTSKEKTKDKDIEAVNYLESRIDMDPATKQKYNRDNFFRQLQEAKQSIGNLGLNDILRKDYKQWTEGNARIKLGISSVVKPMSFLIGKAAAEAADDASTSKRAFLEAIQKFTEERSLNVFAIMTASKSSKDEFQRELFLWTKDPNLVDKLDRFEIEAQQDLSLEAMDENDCWKRTWLQRDISKSRKQVAPLLRKFLNE